MSFTKPPTHERSETTNDDRARRKRQYLSTRMVGILKIFANPDFNFERQMLLSFCGFSKRGRFLFSVEHLEFGISLG